MGIPLLAALAAVPILVAELGVDRFGFLTLLWAVSSYLSLFDLGVGRALTKSVSECAAAGGEGLGELIWSAMHVMLAVSLFVVLGGVLAVILVDWSPEEHWALIFMVLVVPFVIITTGLRGVLEAFGEFVPINIIRIPQGVLTFVAPVIVVKNNGGLGEIAAALLIVRFFALLAHGYCVYSACPEARKVKSWKRQHVNGLLITGGWVSVSNIVNPLMGYMDRFVIGGVISLAAVSYYVTPYEIASKLWIIPGAITAVMFPDFARRLGGKKMLLGAYKKGLLLIFVGVFPVSVLGFVFAKDGMEFWLGESFAAHSWLAMRVFCIGIFVNCLAHVPFTHLQAVGGAKTTAAIHVFEFFWYVPSLFLAGFYFELNGILIVWLFRIVLDAILMFFYSYKMVLRHV